MSKKHKSIVVILEGLPGASKTSIIEACRKSGYLTIEEIISSKIKVRAKNAQFCCEKLFFENDRLKLKVAHMLHASKGIVVVDRGYLSTLAHNYAQCRLGKEHAYNLAVNNFVTLCEQGLKADYYIMLDISEKQSLIRKNWEVDADNPWTHMEGLRLIKKFYHHAIELFEPTVKVFRVDTNKPLSKVTKEVLCILDKIKDNEKLS